MDLYDKKTKSLICEVCASAIPKRDANTRIIREEDKMAFLMEEANKDKMRIAMEEKSKEERLQEQEKNQKAQVASLREDLDMRLKNCSQILESSQKLHAEGHLTREAEGISAVREEIKKVFVESHKELEEMEKKAQEEIDKLISGADEVLSSRYSASRALLDEAHAIGGRTATVSLDTPEMRAIVIKRLQDILESLKKVEALPVKPSQASDLFTLKTQPDAMKKLQIATIVPAENGLLNSVASAEPISLSRVGSPEPQPEMEDDDTVLDRIRAKLKAEESSSRRTRENGRFPTVRSSVNSGMSDDMKREAIGALIFDRGEDVLAAPFEEVIMVTEAFLEKNSLDHILEDLSSPADFNREMRAIYQFLKETHKLS